MLTLFLGNSGPTAAHNVRLRIDPAIAPGAQPLHCTEVQQAAAAGFATLPPGRVMEWYLGVGHEILSAPNQPDEVTLTINGTAGDGTLLRDEFVVRLQDFALTSASPGGMESFAQEFKHFRRESQADRRALVTALRHAIGRDEQP